MNTYYDIAIIGAGPAGLTAAIYAQRAGKSCVLFEKDIPGGNINETYRVENIPGFPSIEGSEFASILTEQASALGAHIVFDEAIAITDMSVVSTNRPFMVETYGDAFQVKAVIIATGTKHNVLGLDHEKDFIGNGIHFCALCDGQFYKNKDVVVVGGGNSALTEALYLANNCKTVTILQNLPKLTGDQILIKRVENTENIKVITNCNILNYYILPDMLSGVNFLRGIDYKLEADGETIRAWCDGVFLCIGLSPRADITTGLLAIDERGYITNSLVDGLYFAGDCSAYNDVKQVVTACGSGATMAVAACNYIDNIGR